MNTGIETASALTEFLTDEGIFSSEPIRVPSRSSATASIGNKGREIRKSPLKHAQNQHPGVYDSFGVNIDPFLKTGGCLFEADEMTFPPIAPKETTPIAARGNPLRNDLRLNGFLINLLSI